MEGADRTRKAAYLGFIPGVGFAIHGTDAVIPAGARLSAQVAAPQVAEPQTASAATHP